MRIAGWLLLLPLLAVAPVPAAAPAGDAGAVLECMRRNAPSRLRVQSLELEHTDAEGTVQTLKGRLWVVRDGPASGPKQVRAMLRVDAPTHLKGAAYLVRQAAPGKGAADGLYVYLPAAKAVRQVTGSVADGALLGTNFTYRDFKQLVGAFEGFTVVREPGDAVRDRNAHVLRFTAPPEPGAPPRTVRMWVDQKSCAPTWAEFYEGGRLRKQLSTGQHSLEQVPAGHWFRNEITMNDVRDGSVTVLRLVESEIVEKLSPRLFDPARFYAD